MFACVHEQLFLLLGAGGPLAKQSSSNEARSRGDRLISSWIAGRKSAWLSGAFGEYIELRTLFFSSSLTGTSQLKSCTLPTVASVAQGKIMLDSISDASVALSLMLEALSLLDGPEHSKAAAYLRDAIDRLSPQKQQEPPSPRGV
jgi:hypothetical protein